MSKSAPIRNSPLDDQISAILIERIESAFYQANSRLPSESELADEFGVSRATIRTALSTLAANGWVKRRHGVGTFIRPHNRVSNSLNEVVDYHDLITGQGFDFEYQHIRSSFKEANQKIAGALNIEQDAAVLEVVKAFISENELLIHTINTIPGDLWELFAGIWLIVKGFSSSEIASASAKPIY